MNERGIIKREPENTIESTAETPMPDAGRIYDDSSRKSELGEASSYPKSGDSCGDVNMEAAITADDVALAGGFGARDDIGRFLPAASDSTDFEASLLDAREFEEPQGEKKRPGLGWIEPAEKE